jgi:hypothetical protein
MRFLLAIMARLILVFLKIEHGIDIGSWWQVVTMRMVAE